MTEAAIWAELSGVFRDVFADDEITLRPETTAEDVEEWDSLTNVQLLMEIERRFGLRFSTGEIANLKNVGELVAAIERRTGAAGAG